MGRGKGDDLSDKRLISGRMGNYRGRPKKEDHEICKKALSIIDNDTLTEWQNEFGITPTDYFKLRYLVIDHEFKRRIGTQGAYTNIPKSYPPAALRKMFEELNVLRLAMGLFVSEIEKAKEKGNTNMLNAVREIFKDDAKYFIDQKKGRGDKVKRESIQRSYKLFENWLKGGATTDLPKTFYRKEKLKGLCVLARWISNVLYEPHERREKELERERASRKMRLLAEKYRLQPSEVFPGIAIIPPTGELDKHSLFGGERVESHDKATHPQQTPSIEKLLEQVLKRRAEVDRLLESLKDI